MSRFECPFEVNPDDVAQLQDAIRTTAETHGLNTDNAVLIGGASLALRGLWTNVPRKSEWNRRPTTSDVDAVAVPGSNKWSRLPLGRNVIHYAPSGRAQLPLTLVRGDKAREFAYKPHGYLSLEAMVLDLENFDGIAALSLAGTLKAKLGLDRVKDRVGILGAHMVAVEQGQPVASDPDWQSAVRQMMDRLGPKNIGRAAAGCDPTLPDWLNQLVVDEFNHPAFEGLLALNAR